MIQPAQWTKTLLDALYSAGYKKLPSKKGLAFVSALGFWKLKIETLGRYPGYGFRVWWQNGGVQGRSSRSRFLYDEAAVLAWLYQDQRE